LGDNEPQLRITKAGGGLLRKTVVECAQYMVGPFGQDSDLRRWGLKMIEAGNGSKRAHQRAVVGVARHLAVLLMSLWKSGQTYDPLRHSRALAVPGTGRSSTKEDFFAVGNKSSCPVLIISDLSAL
jgi:hypothetical protein